MNRERNIRLIDLYYWIFVINVIQSMAFPNSSVAGIIRDLTLGLGIICIFVRHRFSSNREKVLILVTGIIYLIESYVSAYVFGTHNSLVTTSGRLTSISIITLNLIMFVWLDEINLTSKKLNITFCLMSIGMIIASLLSYSIVDVMNAVIGGTRLGGDVSAINLFGMTTAMMAIFLLHTIVDKRRYIMIKILGIVFLALLTASSGSRASLLCLFIGLLIYALITSKNNKLINVIKVAIVMIVLLYFMSLFSFTNTILNRVSTIWNQKDAIVAASDASRMRLIMFGVEQWLKRPLFGYGFNAFTNYSRTVVSINTYSHNNFVELLFNNGIVGFICYYWPRIFVLIHLIKRLKKKQDNTIKLIVTEMIVSLFFDFTIVSYYYISLNFIWIFGWAYLVYSNKKMIDSGEAYE